jgi:hypothetical protein
MRGAGIQATDLRGKSAFKARFQNEIVTILG